MEINKKNSGWLSIVDVNEINRKTSPENILWRLKAVSFDPSTKTLSVSSIPGYDQVLSLESPAKSPGYETSVLSARTDQQSYTRSSSISRPRLESQSSNSSFKQFFSRKLAISRTRSVGKLGIQKASFDSLSPKSPNASWAVWRSQDSEYSYEEEQQETCMCLSNGDQCIVRPIHNSVLLRPFVFQVSVPNESKYFCGTSQEEYNYWMESLTSAVQSNRDEKVRLDTALSIWIIEAKGVPIRKRYLCEISLDKTLFARTSVKTKNDMLFWGEQFRFDDLPATENVTIALYRESDTKKKRKQNIFVGSSVVDLIAMETNSEVERWLTVCIPGVSPKTQQKNALNNKTEQPFIRAKLKYETTVVLQLVAYRRLREFLQNNYLLLCGALEGVLNLKTKDLLAQTFVKILHTSGHAQQFLVDVIMNEVKNTSNENLAFRGNSLATKSIDTYMKMIGKPYLQDTLGAFIAAVYESEEDLEVDPEKMVATGSLHVNQKNLIKLVEEAWRCISSSVDTFPKTLQSVFSTVREQCHKMECDISTKIVSASLFLRFLCPAILSPSLFQLTTQYPSEKVSRTLTLVAKTIQNLANFTRFGSKEHYMEILNEFVTREMQSMDRFLLAVSEKCSAPVDDVIAVCLHIDVARELSVFYQLLKSELPKVGDRGTRLKVLEEIMCEIEKVYNASAKAEELLTHRTTLCKPETSDAPANDNSSACRENSSVSRENSNASCGDSDSQHLKSLGSRYNVIAKDENNTVAANVVSYDDTVLSCSKDYVSGCSLVETCSNNASTSTSYGNGATRVRGRADMRKNSVDMFTKSDEKAKHADSKKENVDSCSRVADSKRKFDKIPTMTPLYRRQPSQNQNASSPAKAIKEPMISSSVKDRISLFSQRSAESSAEKKNSRLPVKDARTFNRLTNVEQQPNEKITNKSTAFDRSKSIDERCTSSEVNQLKNKFDRNKLSLENLSREHLFKDSAPATSKNPSKESLRTPTTNYSSRSSFSGEHSSLSGESRHSTISPSGESRLSSVGQSSSSRLSSIFENGSNSDDTLQLSKDAYTKKGLPTLASQVDGNKRLERHDSENEVFYNSSDHIRHLSADNDNDRQMQRRYSEMTSKQVQLEIDRKNFNRDTMIVAQRREIAQIHSNGFCEILHEGVIERSNSFLSSYSSSLSSYSSEEASTPEGVLIMGDNLSDALNEVSANNRNDHGSDRRVSAVGMSLPRKNSRGHTQSKDQIEMLCQKLREKEIQLQKVQHELKTKTKNFEQTVMHLRDKLVLTNEKMKSQRVETENQMKTVISRLMNMEGELRREQTEMEEIIKAKQNVIEVQEKRICSLEESNTRLVDALTNIKNKYTPFGNDDTDVSNCNGGQSNESEHS